MKKLFSVVLVVLMFSVLISGCGQKATQKEAEAPAKEKVLVYGAEFEYDKVNPLLDTTNVDNMIFNGLVKFDENNSVVPDLVEEWDVSQDGLGYTFYLRRDVKWHDGQPFSAEDVKFSIDKVMDPKTNTPLRGEFKEVKNVEIVDDYTVKIDLKKPFPPLLEKLTMGVVPKHLLEGKNINTAEFNSNPVGTGPFKFQEWKKGSTFTIAAYEDYYEGTPKLDKVIFKFLPDPNVRLVQLETGEIDLAYLEPEQLVRAEKMEEVKIYQVPTADYRVMMYNMQEPLWQDVRVRKALNYAVNRQAIVDGVLLGKGTVAYGPLQLNWANNPDVEKYEYNFDKAKSLLEDGGWKPGSDGILRKDGKKFSFKLTCPITDPVRVNIANALATDFKKLGI